ncbi:c-type cytochrome [Thalassovita taeanensis]|uniref:Sulfur dehydrogenase subunit SoxD n=1 Tax=Thalassovita taeanensis TaxID=657014 RepID=A0A1H9KQQ8_9RHOB|nr:c-type cytochrome [Thalassovita taeanensis]SER01506.1 sulfur dehydrogenase subunit SoxD [Thalassovita taeanensis]
MSKYRKLVITTALAALVASPVLAEKLGLGRAALPEEVAAWNHDVRPDGLGLPEGTGSVEDGETIFSDNCAMCHGEFAEGVDNWPKLAGGMGTLDRDDPLKTVGSYWPYLSTTWDYINRSMPFGNAQTLTPDEVYAIVAYILYSNDMVDDDFVLSKETFLDVEMPNADGFIIDDRAETEYPQFSQAPCMENCKAEVKVTMRAAVLDVTPDVAGDEAAAEMAPAAEEEAAAEPVAAEPVVAEPVVVALDPELVDAGKKVFKKCKACHQVGEGAANKVGPQLNHLIGRTLGGEEGFKYSKTIVEMGEGGQVWTEEALAEFLSKPKSYIAKTKMSFAGLKKDKDIEAVTEYLKSFSQ